MENFNHFLFVDPFVDMNMSEKTYLEFLSYSHCLHDIESRNSMCKPVREIQGKTAEELLKLSGQTDVIPVDLSQILKTIGISALPRDFSKMEENLVGENKILGALVSKGDNAAIFYRDDTSVMSPHRYRFTIAHELGHACLTGESNHIEFRIDNISGDPQERAANIFAGELLIPRKQLEEIIQKLYIPTVHTLADIFEVSYNVMKARLSYLKLDSAVLD